MRQNVGRHSIPTLAREVAVIAHARALHAVHPILRLGAPRMRDVIYRAMAEEFRELSTTIEDLLRRSDLARAGECRSDTALARSTTEREAASDLHEP